MPCEYCGGGTRNHAKCENEWRRRRDEHVCTSCGDRKMEYGWSCGVCHGEFMAGRVAPYRGYPGVS